MIIKIDLEQKIFYFIMIASDLFLNLYLYNSLFFNYISYNKKKRLIETFI